MNPENIEKAEYPIKIFYRNIPKAIEEDYSITKNEHLKNIYDNKIERGIQLLCHSHILRGPFVKERAVVFYESFYGFSWAVIFFLLTGFERYYIPISNAKFLRQPPPEIPEDLLIQGFKLFEWANKLKTEYLPWPTEILTFDKTDSWQNKVTAVWIRTITFIFYHEYAHLTLGHTGTSGIEEEKDADNFAFNLFLSHSYSLSRNIENALGAGCAMVINLFILNDVYGLSQGDTHPDLDTRLDNFIKNLQFDNEEIKATFVLFGAFASSMFLRLVAKRNDFYFKTNDVEKMWDECLVEFDKIKLNP